MLAFSVSSMLSIMISPSTKWRGQIFGPRAKPLSRENRVTSPIRPVFFASLRLSARPSGIPTRGENHETTNHQTSAVRMASIRAVAYSVRPALNGLLLGR